MESIWSKELADGLMALAESKAEAYQAASPFPHAVFDDFLPAEIVREALAAYPSREALQWLRFEGQHEKKLAFFQAEALPGPLRDLLHFLNSATILKFLQTLTGIPALLPDPHFYGGGLHFIERGGFLEMHADFNRLTELNVNRRLNLLIYMNPDWKEEYGGHLELWDTSMTRCEQRILPALNRCVVFSTTSDSYHGHPHPLTCPERMSRRSIATYYYTAPTEAVAAPEFHSTIFKERPQEGTGDAAGGNGGGGGLKRALKPFAPPILVDAWRKLKG